jgi:hypothetical protein
MESHKIVWFQTTNQLGIDVDIPQKNGKIIQMFQTTNQLIVVYGFTAQAWRNTIHPGIDPEQSSTVFIISTPHLV